MAEQEPLSGRDFAELIVTWTWPFVAVIGLLVVLIVGCLHARRSDT